MNWSYGVAEIVSEDGTVDCYRIVEIGYDRDWKPIRWTFDVSLFGSTVESVAEWLEQAAEDVRDNDGKPHVRIKFNEEIAREEHPHGLDYMEGEFLIDKATGYIEEEKIHEEGIRKGVEELTELFDKDKVDALSTKEV